MRCRAGVCIHYRGVYSPDMGTIDLCGAGVSYDKISGGRGTSGWLGKLPCLAINSAGPQCEKKVLPTDEQVAAYRKWQIERTDRTMQAAAICKEHAGGKTKVSATIDCPICKGRLSYTVASNGHMWGQCATPDCVGWME